MAKCELSIQLDEPDRTYEHGELVTGRLIVEVFDAVRCDGLSIQHRWKTHGRGNTDQGIADSEVVFVGEWEEPGTYEYEFEFTQPNGPQTYHGYHLNVDWYVYATVDIPWALDPDAEVDHLARYTGSREAYVIGSEDNLESSDEQMQGCLGCLGGVGLTLVFVALFSVWSFLQDGEGASLAIGLVLFAVGGGLAWMAFSRILASNKLGEIEVSFDPERAFPGEEVTCRVSITPPKSTELNGLEHILSAAEVVVRGSGTNKSTYRKDLFEASATSDWTGPETLEGGVEHLFEQTFVIPEDAPPSFDSGDDNKLEWLVETHVDIPSWPDWSGRDTLIVVPGETHEQETREPVSPRSDGEETSDWW